MFFLRDQRTERFEVFEYLFACVEAIEATVGDWCGVADFGVERQYADGFKLVPQSDLKVVGVMGGGDLHATSAEGFVHVRIGNDRNQTRR